MFRFLDAVSIAGTKETQEGYLIADAFAVRTGTQIYAGYEVGKPELSKVTIYRPDTEVFSQDTLQSFSHVPVTNDHPIVPVTADNWKDLAVGETSTDILRDGHRMKIPLILKDKDAIAAVKGGKRELSAGYSCDLEFVDGVTPEGVPYNAIQRNIRANHVAIVARGRAGPDFKIGDSIPTWGLTPQTTNDREIPQMEKFVIDGITIETTPQGAQALTKMQDKLTVAVNDKAALATTHASAIALLDTEIGALKIKLSDAEKKVPDVTVLDQMVADRLVVVDQAKKIAPNLVVKGLSDAEIKRAAVVAKYGETVVGDASEAEVSGMFKTAVLDKSTGDPLRKNLMQSDKAPTPVDLSDNGQTAYEDRLSNAWKAE